MRSIRSWFLFMRLEFGVTCSVIASFWYSSRSFLIVSKSEKISSSKLPWFACLTSITKRSEYVLRKVWSLSLSRIPIISAVSTGSTALSSFRGVKVGIEYVKQSSVGRHSLVWAGYSEDWLAGSFVLRIGLNSWLLKFGSLFAGSAFKCFSSEESFESTTPVNNEDTYHSEMGQGQSSTFPAFFWCPGQCQIEEQSLQKLSLLLPFQRRRFCPWNYSSQAHRWDHPSGTSSWVVWRISEHGFLSVLQSWSRYASPLSSSFCHRVSNLGTS